MTAGGARRNRTDDLLLAKQALSQLSYGPALAVRGQRREMVGLGRFELPTSRLSSARSNQLSYRPMKHTLVPRIPKSAGNICSNDLGNSVGSSEKKEKRRRRSPAKDLANPETGRSGCVPKRTDRRERMLTC